MTTFYDDIIRLPRPVSRRHPPMAALARAAQFAPFAALSGYEGILAESIRPTDRRMALSEDERAELNLRLRCLADHAAQHPSVTFTLFVPDDKKAGGSYVTRTGCVKRVEEAEQRLVLINGDVIGFEEIAALSSAAFAKDTISYLP